MLKLNASFSKKVPREQEYSSKGYSATIEVELPDGLSEEQLRGKVHETFELVRTSVEEELNSSHTNPVSREQVRTEQKWEKASPRQLKYVSDLVRQTGSDLDELLNRYGVRAIYELSRQQCSEIIDYVTGKRVA